MMAGQWFRNTKEILAPMTWRERLDYLWGYYKLHFIIGVFVIAMLISLISSMAAPKTETLFNGVLVSVSLTEEGKTYLTEDAFRLLGGTDPAKQEVTVLEAYSTVSTGEYSVTDDVYLLMSVAAWIAAQDVDYLLMDQSAADHFCGTGTFADLNEVLSAQQMTALEDRLVYYEPEEGDAYPVAIDLSGTELAEMSASGSGLCIGFPGNTGRSEKISVFVDHLLEASGEAA